MVAHFVFAEKQEAVMKLMETSSILGISESLL